MRNRLVSTLAAVMATTTLVVLGGASAAQAAEPQNVGWLYTLDGDGAVFFDADLAGYPGYEKVTVCDNDANGMGVQANVYLYSDSWHSRAVNDPSSDGHCASIQGDFFPEGAKVGVEVGEYFDDYTWIQYNRAYGVA